MNLLHKSAVVAVATLGLASAVHAGVIINGVDAGAVDSLIRQTSDLSTENGGAGGNCSANASSPANESCWVSNVLGFSVSLSEYSDPQPYFESSNTPGTYGFAFAAGVTPDFYLLKNAKWWGLFDNLDSLAYAVFQASDLDAVSNIGTTPLTISHVRIGPNDDNGGGGGGGNPMPLPGTVALLGLGLLAAGVARSRKA